MERVQKAAELELSIRNEAHPWPSDQAKRAFIRTNELHYYLGELPQDMRSHVEPASEAEPSTSIQWKLQEHIALYATCLRELRATELAELNAKEAQAKRPMPPSQVALHTKAYWPRERLALDMPNTPRTRFHTFIGPIEEIISRFDGRHSPNFIDDSRSRAELTRDIETLHACLGMMSFDMRCAVTAPHKDDGFSELDTKLTLHISVLTSALQKECPPDGEDFSDDAEPIVTTVPKVRRAYFAVGGLALIALIVAMQEARFSSFILYSVAWVGLIWLLPVSILGPRTFDLSNDQK